MSPQFSKLLWENGTTPLKTNEIIYCNQSRMVRMGGSRQGTVTRSIPIQQGLWAGEAMTSRHRYSEQVGEWVSEWMDNTWRLISGFFILVSLPRIFGRGHMFLEALFWGWNRGSRTLIVNVSISALGHLTAITVILRDQRPGHPGPRGSSHGTGGCSNQGTFTHVSLVPSTVLGTEEGGPRD